MLDRSWREPSLIEKAVSAIECAYDEGITLFDVADSYAGGLSESAFRTVLANRPNMRERIAIQTKCGQLLPEGWVPGDPHIPSPIDLSSRHILESVDASLKRLGTDYIDSLLLHLPDQLMEPDQVAEAFDKLLDTGKVRAFGVSNHSASRIRLLQRHLTVPLKVNQIWFGLGSPSPICGETGWMNDSLVDYCWEHDITIQAYSPLKTRFDGLTGGSSLLSPPKGAQKELYALSSALGVVAESKGTTPAAVALAWILRHPSAPVPIIGTSDPKLIRENLAALEVELSREEWYELYHKALGLHRTRS